MRFLLDMPITPRLATWLQARGHQALLVRQIGPPTMSDADILREARRRQAVVITLDRGFPGTLRRLGFADVGLILFGGATVTAPGMLALMGSLLDQVDARDLLGWVTVIRKQQDRYVIRRRRLPLP